LKPNWKIEPLSIGDYKRTQWSIGLQKELSMKLSLIDYQKKNRIDENPAETLPDFLLPSLSLFNIL
jgi:hypothetical protein